MQILLFFSAAIFARTPKQTGNAAGGAVAVNPALIYSTYVSRSVEDLARGVAVGRDGSIYLAGRAATTGTDKGDAFVAHISADGSSLLYLVYLGGNGDTEARAIAVNAAGNVYVTGETYAADFPVRNALQSSCSLNSARACSGDAFLTKLSPDGVVIFSTYLGGSGEDGANTIALDAAGNIYLGGATASTDFPVSRAQQANYGGNGDGFLAQIAGDGSRVMYASYLGGAGADEVRGIRLDAAGNIYVTGQTHSFDFPVANAIQTNCRADAAGKCNGEAFITKLAAISGSGSSILFSTYLGGSGGDAGNGITVAAQGNIYVTGTTSSADFPVTNALEAAGRGKSKAFVTKLSGDGTMIGFSTYLGGTEADEGDSIDVDGAGNVYVAGGTQSTDFPLVNAIQASCTKDSNGACFENAFVAALDSSGTVLKFSSYLGGTGNQAGRGIALDLRGGAYLAGGTGSTDFPGAKPVQISKSAAGNPAALNSTAITAVSQTRGGAFISKIAGVNGGTGGATGGLAGPLPQAATTCTGTATIWLGGTGVWSNAANWSTGVVPNSTSTNVCIDNGNNLNSVVTLDISASVGSLTVDSGDELIVGDNQSLIVAGNISNDGLIAISAANNNTFLRIQGAVSLTGAGALTLSTSGGGTAFINQNVANSVLTNVNSTIDGFGQIGNNGLALVNQAGATINADAGGKTLQLAGVASGTNAGLMESNGGVLQLNAATYNNLGGTITSNGSGSTVQLVNSVVIQGGTLNANGGGVLGTGANNTVTLDGVSHGSVTILGTYALGDNSTTIVSGTLVNSGTIQFNGAANNTFLRASGAVTLTGGGTVTLNTTGGGTAFINQNIANSTLTNVNNLIQGKGQIGNNGLALVNQAAGTINANAVAALVINANSFTNPGLLEATTGGTLQLNAVTCNNAGGTITANGNGSTVQLANGTIIQGGLLTTTLGGVLGTAAGNTVTLDGSTPSGMVTNQGTYTGADNSSTLWVGTINNTGAFLIAAAGNNVFLRATGAVTLMGGGTVTLTTSGGGTALINQTVINSTLTNVDNSIEGKGQIGNNGLALVNETSGVIDANVLGATLVLNPNGFTNQGLMEATLGAILQLNGTVFNNLGGNITSSGAGSTVQFENSATIQGGTITSSGGGALGTAAGQTITLDGAAKGPLTIAGIYTSEDNSSTILVGTIANTGTVQIDAAGNNTFLKITNGVTLTGAGVVVLSSTPGGGTAFINQLVANSTLTNSDNTIRGAGQIGNNGLAVINKAAILASTSGQTLVLNPNGLTNQGLLQAAGGGTMVLNGTTFNNQAGTIQVDGAASAMQFVNGSIIQGGTLTTTNGGVLGVAQGQSISLDGSTLGALSIVGTYTGADNSSTIVLGTINNTGTIQIDASNNNTFLKVSNGVTLQGAGAVKLSTTGGGTAIINQQIANSVLTNADNAIQGRGQIGNNGLSVINKATILANVSGQALVLNPNALTNQGVLEASLGGTLQLSNAAIVNQSGSITVDGAGSVMQFVNDATIQGGTISTSNGGVLGAAQGQTITLDGNSLGPLRIVGTYTGPDNSSTIVTGTINNTGAIQIIANNNNTFLKVANGATLTGAGTVALSTTGGGEAFINQLIANSTLTNVDNIIQGTGQIGNNGLTVINQGSVEANQNGRALVLNPQSLTNAGMLEGFGGGTLQLSNAAINNSGGSIKVDGNTSAVQFVNGATIQGGILTTANGGVLGAAAGQTISLDGSTHGVLTNLGTYTGADNSSTILFGNVINSGLIRIQAAGNNTFLKIDGAVNLSGAGAVMLSTSGGGTAFINQLIANSILNNTGNVIQGTGQIGNNGLTLINQGTVNANLTGLGMVLNPSTVTNAGLLESSTGGVLVLSNASIKNAGGSIVVDGAASAVQFVNSAIIQGGTIGTVNGGVLGVAAGNTITLDGSTFGPLTNSGTYTGADNSSTLLAGVIVNNGTILVSAVGNNTFVKVNGAVNLQGTGTVTLGTSGGGTAFINQLVANSTLTNVANTIQGRGQIGNNGLALVNQGTIGANLAGFTLQLNPSTLTNQGLLEATAGGSLQLSNSLIANAGGTIEVDGANSAAQFVNNVVIQGGTLTTANNGVLGSVSGNNVTLDGTANAVAIGAGGTYTVGNNSTTNIQGTINNLGTVMLNSTGNPTFLSVPVAESATLTGGGTVTMTASANTINGPALDNSGNTIQDLAALSIAAFTQDGGTTVIAVGAAGTSSTFLVNGGIAQVDGALNVSNGVTVASGGTLSGTGTISGNVTMNGTVQGGDLSNPGALAIAGNGAGNFTQGAPGIFNVPIGGTAAGSQFSQVNLTGTANLSGTLNASLINGFTPVVGNQFTILTAGSLVGQFAATNLPGLPAGLSWKVTNNPASVVLSVEAIPPTLVSIAVTPANPTVAAGNSQQFTATGTFSDSSTQNLTNTATWASSDGTIATVSGTGLASSKKVGSATISATQSSVTGQTTLTVSAAVLVSIAVTPKNPSTAAGTTVPFTATGTFSDGSTQNLTNSIAWASSDTTIATINGTGLATAVKAGSTTISATQGAVSGQTTLTVTVSNFTLTVVLAGTGTGSVKSNGGGIDCPSTSCSGSFAQGTQVLLTATAASGSSFTSFAGGGCANANPCTVIVNAATTVTATFDTAGTPSFTPAPGSGLTATGNPGDTFIFPLQLTGPPGQTITLSCTPDPAATTITCAVAPPTVTLNAQGTTSTFIQVSSFCSWGAPQLGPQDRLPGNWLLVLGALALLGCAFAARKRRLAFAVPIAILAMLLISVVGCSDRGVGPSGRTPPGTYHLTITAKSQSGATGQIVLTMIIK